ncbi:hypothetical protein HK105_208479 [Polyrhizophydium stewartii]|uniref:DUF4442 domain-containing protein n=1 Tax=Polyrhizophydium stewartii TaxID=2732419 RepID=A0ABR4MXR4_9FUNG|nr:hypothetical protein HK105_006047 [Polyrhizophydium stewartii]
MEPTELRPAERRRARSGKKASHSLLKTWQYWSRVPFIGRWVFGWLLLFASPYTGTLSLRIHRLVAGACRASMGEWWLLRNPFRSIHAAALLNLGEAAGGFAVISWCETQEEQHRAIVTRLEIDYIKKARGVITAVCELDPSKPLLPAGQTRANARVVTDLFDAKGDLVAKTTAVWSIERVPDKRE